MVKTEFRPCRSFQKSFQLQKSRNERGPREPEVYDVEADIANSARLQDYLRISTSMVRFIFRLFDWSDVYFPEVSSNSCKPCYISEIQKVWFNLFFVQLMGQFFCFQPPLSPQPSSEPEPEPPSIPISKYIKLLLPTNLLHLIRPVL